MRIERPECIVAYSSGSGVYGGANAGWAVARALEVGNSVIRFCYLSTTGVGLSAA